MPGWGCSTRRSASSAARRGRRRRRALFAAGAGKACGSSSRPFCERCGRPYEGAITTRFECAQLPGDGMAFPLGALGGGGARPGAGGDSPLQVPAGALVRAVPGRVCSIARRRAGLGGRRPGTGSCRSRCIPPKSGEREFNQAERLAERLGAATRIPVNNRLLRRVVPTRTQTQLSREERLANVRNAFAHAGRPAVERRAHRAGGRRVHHGRDDQRLRPGAEGRPGRAKFASGQLPAEFE